MATAMPLIATTTSVGIGHGPMLTTTNNNNTTNNTNETNATDETLAMASSSASSAPSSSWWWWESHTGSDRMTRTLAHYDVREQIGEGTYGQVYRGWCRDSQRPVALKKMRIHHGGYWGMPLQLIREIKILKRLHHPNLLELLEVVTSKGVEHLDPDDPPQPKHRDAADRVADVREGYKGNLFLVLEYVPHDLTGLLDIHYNFTTVQIKCIVRQLLEALHFMHSQKYIHRDIKSSNILLDDHFRVKLADFGLARSMELPLLEQLQTPSPPPSSSGTLPPSSSTGSHGMGRNDLTNKVITLWYRPPEILVGATQYGPAVDVWSTGCILAELMLGKPLFTGKTELDQWNHILDILGTPSEDVWHYLQHTLKKSKGLMTPLSPGKEPRANRLHEKYGHKLPDVAIALVEKLLEWDPRKRVSAQHALEHRYFWTTPRAPENPAELGPIFPHAVHGDFAHFHEFQTKKKRKEAKAVAEQARDQLLAQGVGTEQAQAKFDEVYQGLMQQVARTGFATATATTTKEASVAVTEMPKESAPIPPPPPQSLPAQDRNESKEKRRKERKRRHDDNDEFNDKSRNRSKRSLDGKSGMIDQVKSRDMEGNIPQRDRDVSTSKPKNQESPDRRNRRREDSTERQRRRDGSPDRDKRRDENVDRARRRDESIDRARRREEAFLREEARRRDDFTMDGRRRDDQYPIHGDRIHEFTDGRPTRPMDRDGPWRNDRNETFWREDERARYPPDANYDDRRRWPNRGDGDEMDRDRGERERFPRNTGSSRLVGDRDRLKNNDESLRRRDNRGAIGGDDEFEHHDTKIVDRKTPEVLPADDERRKHKERSTERKEKHRHRNGKEHKRSRERKKVRSDRDYDRDQDPPRERRERGDGDPDRKRTDHDQEMHVDRALDRERDMDRRKSASGTQQNASHPGEPRTNDDRINFADVPKGSDHAFQGREQLRNTGYRDVHQRDVQQRNVPRDFAREGPKGAFHESDNGPRDTRPRDSPVGVSKISIHNGKREFIHHEPIDGPRGRYGDDSRDLPRNVRRERNDRLPDGPHSMPHDGPPDRLRPGPRQGPREGSRDGPRRGRGDGGDEPPRVFRDGPRDGPGQAPRIGSRDDPYESGPRNDARGVPSNGPWFGPRDGPWDIAAQHGNRDGSRDMQRYGPRNESRAVPREGPPPRLGYNEDPNDGPRHAPRPRDRR